jgi:hypothetical protein
MTKETAPEPTIYERLAAIFPHECVEWRAQTFNKEGTSALALAYVDARSIMARLDEVMGPANWKDSYVYAGNRTFCVLELRINGEWIGKSDVSDDSNFEAAKGGASGSFKRAGVKWGIGRYLYDVEAVWADCSAYKNNKGAWVFKNWTDAGQRTLEAALGQAPGVRSTEKPESVRLMLDLIAKAKTEEELTEIRKKHWSAIGLEYRAEVIRAGTNRKRELADAKPVAREQPRTIERQSRPPARRGTAPARVTEKTEGMN